VKRDGDLPGVDDDPLHSYYRYLTQHLSLPFAAFYPQRVGPFDEPVYACDVIRLLDPKVYHNGHFLGVFCVARNCEHLVELPVIELDIDETGPTFQLIEDYWFWFWNWS